jgi:DUF438 domain-containing protein
MLAECPRSIGISADRAAELENLPAAHVIRIMMQENYAVLQILNELESLNRTIKTVTHLSLVDFSALERIAESLLEAEPHHQREEQVFFPLLEKPGFLGLPLVMRREHQELRECEQELKEFAVTGKEMYFSEFKEQLNAIADFIIKNLRQHIDKENNILYPKALEIIHPEMWEQIKQDCDRIGYFSLTKF